MPYTERKCAENYMNLFIYVVLGYHIRWRDEAVYNVREYAENELQRQ